MPIFRFTSISIFSLSPSPQMIFSHTQTVSHNDVQIKAGFFVHILFIYLFIRLADVVVVDVVVVVVFALASASVH